MQVRVKFRPPEIPDRAEVEQKALVSAKIGAALLPALALMAGVLAIWRFGTDVEWTRDFPIEQGLLSHWQVWLALAIGMQAAGTWARRDS